MRTLLIVLPVWFLLSQATLAGRPAESVQVAIETNKGRIVVELDPERAPLTVENFMRYVDAGHYDETIFHRVIPGFMAQGGGYTTDFEVKPTHSPVPNESGNGLSNVRGSIAMARTGDPHSATGQFYVNLVDNIRLDPNSEHWGYTVFGRVVEGMDVLNAIAEIPTGPAGPFPRDVPQETVVILKIDRFRERRADGQN